MTKHTDILQAKTEGIKHEAGTRQNDCIQAETEGSNLPHSQNMSGKGEGGRKRAAKQIGLLQDKTKGDKHEDKTEGAYLET